MPRRNRKVDKDILSTIVTYVAYVCVRTHREGEKERETEISVCDKWLACACLLWIDSVSAPCAQTLCWAGSKKIPEL